MSVTKVVRYRTNPQDAAESGIKDRCADGPWRPTRR
jgi:hypothetical protein